MKKPPSASSCVQARWSAVWEDLKRPNGWCVLDEHGHVLERHLTRVEAHQKAAAPEILAALKTFIEMSRPVVSGDDFYLHISALLARAEGRLQ